VPEWLFSGSLVCCQSKTYVQKLEHFLPEEKRSVIFWDVTMYSPVEVNDISEDHTVSIFRVGQ
jgi:hypothetical protein